MNKRREQELVKLRRDLEDQAMQNEANSASLRKKHQDAVNELADQLDQVQKARQKYVLCVKRGKAGSTSWWLKKKCNCLACRLVEQFYYQLFIL